MLPVFPFAVALLAALLAATPIAAAEPDTRGYERLLEDGLTLLRSNGVPVRSAFDYVRLHSRPGHPREAGELPRIHRQMLAVPPARMTAAERTAWGINLYNFLVIESVVAHFGEDGTPPPGVTQVAGFFDTPAVEVEGREYSLNAFERHFLFADFDGKGDAPPAGIDPRIHFALVCAARSCPPLAARPYRAATLERDLDDAVRGALQSDQHLRADPKADGYAISSIFDWYAKDFGGRGEIAKFLARYAPADARTAFANRGEDAIAGFLPWDWKLNQTGPWSRGAAPVRER